MTDEMDKKPVEEVNSELTDSELDEVSGGAGGGGGAGKQLSPKVNLNGILIGLTPNPTQMGDGSVKPGDASMQDFH